MSILKSVLQEEYQRLIELFNNYEDKLKKLPKGSISRKVINGEVYLYRVFRENGKIRFIYIGKEKSEVGKKALRDRKEHIKYQDLLKQVKSEIKEIRRALNGYK
jgi:hypothetical protein